MSRSTIERQDGYSRYTSTKDVSTSPASHGVNVVSGETAAEHQSGYVVDAHDSVRIDGWRKSLDEVATFYFTRLADSYAARTGRPHDIGVIGVALFRERSRCCYPYHREDLARDEARAPAEAP